MSCRPVRPQIESTESKRDAIVMQKRSFSGTRSDKEDIKFHRIVLFCFLALRLVLGVDGKQRSGIEEGCLLRSGATIKGGGTEEFRADENSAALRYCPRSFAASSVLLPRRLRFGLFDTSVSGLLFDLV